MADQLYDSLICFAYWEALPDKETVEEFKKTVDQTFFGQKIPTLPKWFSGENQKLLDLIAFLVKPFIDRSINRYVCSGEWNNAWKVYVNPKKKPKEGTVTRHKIFPRPGRHAIIGVAGWRKKYLC